MRLPSLELSSDSYWIPVNAVFQKRHVVPTDSYDQNAASFNKTNQVELPSLHAAGDKTRSTAVMSDQPLRTNSETGPVEDLPDSVTEPLSNEAASHTTYQTSYGRLRSGKLGSNSSSIPSIQPDELQGLAIGVQRSPYDKLVSNLAAMAHAKKSIQELYNSTTEYSKRLSARQTGRKSPTPTSANEADSATPHVPGLTLNQLDIMQEHSEHDELLAESAIFCGPTVELKLTEVNDSSLNKAPFQDSLFKPSNTAISFTKPRKLFSVKSVQNKMRQHSYSDSKGMTSRGRGGAALKREDSHSLYNAKHRLALNKENSGNEEGVFGMETHPAKRNSEEGVCRKHTGHQVSCALRSQERMRLQLKTATGSRRRVSTASSSSSSAAGGRKVQVYLIKTSRPLEDILPRLNSTEVYCQQNGTVDLFGE